MSAPRLTGAILREALSLNNQPAILAQLLHTNRNP